MAERTPEELAEFAALSVRVADRAASAAELERWRELRVLLAPTAPPAQPGQLARASSRLNEKIRVGYVPLTAMSITFTEDVSAGGLRVRTQKHFEDGTLLLIRLELGRAAEPITVLGKVAWSKRESGHFLTGVEFVGLRSEQRERIEAHAVTKGNT